jgi:hypothetical protein
MSSDEPREHNTVEFLGALVAYPEHLRNEAAAAPGIR